MITVARSAFSVAGIKVTSTLTVETYVPKPLVPKYQTPSPQMEAPCLSETLALAYQNTRCRNTDDQNVNVHLLFIQSRRRQKTAFV
jgi:hypothetical protein